MTEWLCCPDINWVAFFIGSELTDKCSQNGQIRKGGLENPLKDIYFSEIITYS